MKRDFSFRPSYYRSGLPGPAFTGAVLVMGASGIIAQLILLRELLITFLSNELTIGIILANWLILEAVGSWLGKFIEKIRRKLHLFMTVTGIFSVCLPLAVYLARTWKVLIGAGPGEGMGLHQIFMASFVILLPVCLSHGALFTFSCSLMTASDSRDAKGIGKVYFLETVGTIAGGLIFSFLMVTLMNSFEAAFILLIVNVAVCIILYIIYETPSSHENVSSRSLKAAAFSKLAMASGAFFLLIFLSLLLIREAAPVIQQKSISDQWSGQDVVHYQNSFYGNTAVIEREGEYTYFTDGVPAMTVPTPDVIFAEEFIHLPLLFQPRRENILVISGGAGGVINELLKHAVKRVDYVELDPLILKLVRKFPTDLTDAELGDPRVHVHYRDGRLYLRETRGRYDVILVGLSDPQDLQINRFFTKQFFSLVHSKLEDSGIIVFTLPGSLTYLGDELKDLNACILNTLKDVFPGVRVIPGDGYNLILASPSQDTISCSLDLILQRFRNADLNLRYLTPFAIDYRLDPKRSRWFAETMIGGTDKRNEDFRPLSVFYSLSYWNAKFVPGLRVLFNLGQYINLPFLMGTLVITFFVLLFPVARSKRPLHFSVPVAIAATGLTGMILELAIMFAFQALYGIVFYWMSLLITSFMAGVAIGSLGVTHWMERVRSYILWFICIEAFLALFCIILPFLFLVSETFLQNLGRAIWIQVLFLLLSVVAGFLIGLQFPLAGKIYLGSSVNIGTTAGLLYAADLAGGWVGGVIGGVFLLPVAGIINTCLFLGTLKLVSGFLVAVGRWKEKGS